MPKGELSGRHSLGWEDVSTVGGTILVGMLDHIKKESELEAVYRHCSLLLTEVIT